MISTWKLNRQAENYLGQLEQLLVKRIRISAGESGLRASAAPESELSDLSREINEELERIEALVNDCENGSSPGLVHCISE
jgi:methyl-accepting chemotaxis protein